MKNLSSILMGLILMLSCSSPVSHSLDRAERIMQDHPDSAYSSLASIPPSLLKGKKEQARYALLMSMAMDKCYMDTAEDSLISVASRYYQRHGSATERMLADYYLGRVQKNAGNDTEAAFRFLKAERQAQELGNYLYEGLSAFNLCELYTKHGETGPAVECAREAVKAYRKTGRPVYVESARLALARAFENNSQYEEGRQLFDSLLREEGFFHKEVERSYAELLFNQGDKHAKEALGHYLAGESDWYGSNEYGSMARACLLMGDTRQAAVYLHRADSLATSVQEIAALAYDRYRIGLLQKDSSSALVHLEKAVSLQDSLTRNQFRKSFSASLLEQERIERKMETDQHRRLLAWLLLGGWAMAVTILLLVRSVQTKRKDIRDLMGRMDMISSEWEQVSKEKTALADTILREQVDALRILSEEYFKNGETRQQRHYYQAFKQQLMDIRNHTAEIGRMEEHVNRFKDNAVALLREEVPGLSPYSYKLAVLFFAGLPYELISLLVQSSVATLRTQKSLLRKAIMDAGAPHRDLLLSYLKTEPHTSTNASSPSSRMYQRVPVTEG